MPVLRRVGARYTYNIFHQSEFAFRSDIRQLGGNSGPQDGAFLSPSRHRDNSQFRDSIRRSLADRKLLLYIYTHMIPARGPQTVN